MDKAIPSAAMSWVEAVRSTSHDDDDDDDDDDDNGAMPARSWNPVACDMIC